jgi:hypothetical protein
VFVVIGVFFDGTLNNASNTAAGMMCGAHHPIKPEDLDASCQPYMTDPDSSYGNDVSNVAKLSELYFASEKLLAGEQGKLAYRKIYIDGIGSLREKKTVRWVPASGAARRVWRDGYSRLSVRLVE